MSESITRIKLILGLCMHKNAYTRIIQHFSGVQIKNKKQKNDRPTDPPDFQAKRASKPFIFSGLTIMLMHLKVLLVRTRAPAAA